MKVTSRRAGSFEALRTRWVTVLLGCCILTEANGYSVLTHEAIIDSAWKDNIQPLLLKRFPDASPDDLRKAHAYTYGGAIIQDMGYYPFGHKFVGALAHYASDNFGHRVAVNKSVPIIYPKLKRKFGNSVTYADNPVSHLKVEFSFDVAQVAQGHYASNAYHEFIGFEVAQAALERAFVKTYSVKLSSLMKEDLAIGTYRFTVSSIIPTMTRAAWRLKKKEILKAQPGMDKRKFMYNLSRAEYRKKWGTAYRGPGIEARFIAFIVRIAPRVGPLRSLGFQPPTPATETLFMKSVNETLAQYRRLLTAQGHGVLKLPNENFDTGEPTKPGAYTLADATYARLLDTLNGKPVSEELR